MKNVLIASVLSLIWVGQAGNGNVIIGNGNRMNGNGNLIKGDYDNVNGNSNVQIGDSSFINGNNNVHFGNNQQIFGDNQYLNNQQGQVINPLIYGQIPPSNGLNLQTGVPSNYLGLSFAPGNLPLNQPQQNYLQPSQQQIPININQDLLLAQRLQLLNNIRNNLRIQANTNK